jgi:hypothetical protein
MRRVVVLKAAVQALMPGSDRRDSNKALPTLPPEKFTGMTRNAYQAAREIPQTLAQRALPKKSRSLSPRLADD